MAAVVVEEEEEPSERGLNKAWSCNRVQKGKCFWAVNESQTRNPALFPPCDRRRERRGADVPRMRNRFLARWGGAARRWKISAAFVLKRRWNLPIFSQVG